MNETPKQLAAKKAVGRVAQARRLLEEIEGIGRNMLREANLETLTEDPPHLIIAKAEDTQLVLSAFAYSFAQGYEDPQWEVEFERANPLKFSDGEHAFAVAHALHRLMGEPMVVITKGGAK